MNATWVPGINIVLGLVCFTWLSLRTSNRWGEYPQEIRLLLLALIAVLFALITTSVEQFINREETPLRSALVITFVKLVTLAFLFRTRTTLYRTGERSPDTRDAAPNDSDEPNRDIEA